MNASPAERPAPQLSRSGLAYGLAAYGLWGVMPIYFKQIADVPAVDIVAHRIVWSVVVLAAFLTLARAWGELRRAVAAPRTLALLALTAVLIAANWLLYVYAINNGHILAGSLGYYLNPLANILLGRFLLGEHLTRRQWWAVALAAAGVAVLATGALDTLWISLLLCFSFASYGLLRKVAPVESLAGLSVETGLLAPFALFWLLLGGASGVALLAHPQPTMAMLAAAGLISTVPLLCFTAAARRLPYSTVGMLQFLAPTLQFALAVFVYGEPLTTAHLVAFAAIWAALGLYASSLVPQRREAGPELAEG